MVVEPIITCEPELYVKRLEVDADNLPACVVTRANQMKKQNEGHILPSDQHADIYLSDTFIIAIENTCIPEKEHYQPHYSKSKLIMSRREQSYSIRYLSWGKINTLKYLISVR